MNIRLSILIRQVMNGSEAPQSLDLHEKVRNVFSP